MVSRVRFSKILPIAGLAAVIAAGSACAQDASSTRVIRLGFVEGTVAVQRPEMQGWAEAPVNTPLQEGFKLSTGEDSYAEIQFENGGTIRLGELSLLELRELRTAASGGKNNHVELRQGYATFHLLPSGRGDTLQVDTTNGTLTAQGGTMFRVDLDQEVERVEVFDGTVNAQGNLGHMTIDKDYALLMQPGASEPTVVSKGITEDDWDHWVDDRESDADASSTVPTPQGYDGDASEAPYGWTDLQENGNWSNVAGLGYGWTPTTVAADWAPYTVGGWCWYPGYGYTWISAEPWGWLPYHYGWWKFLPGRGWIWFPGNFRAWSPALVTWYSGPNWIGWTVRAQRGQEANACGGNCGGGVVSSVTFRQGGMLTANLMLNINPASGGRVKEPGIAPLASAWLPGRTEPSPAALSQGIQVGSPRPSEGSESSAIVYDAQHNRYVNGNVPSQPQPARSYSGAGAQNQPVTNSGLIQPVPATGREASNHPMVNPNPCASSLPSMDCVIGPRRLYTSPEKPSPSSHPGVSGAPVAGHPVPAPAFTGGGHAEGGGSAHPGAAPAGGGAAGHH